MEYSYRFWTIALTPFDRFLNLFGYYIMFQYDMDKNRGTFFDRFDGFTITHYSKINDNL